MRNYNSSLSVNSTVSRGSHCGLIVPAPPGEAGGNVSVVLSNPGSSEIPALVVARPYPEGTPIPGACGRNATRWNRPEVTLFYDTSIARSE